MPQYYYITTAPTPVISLEDAKKQLRIDPIVTHEDNEILAFIDQATEIAENYIGRIIAQRTLEIKSGDFVREIKEAYTPVSSIVSIKTELDNGAIQTLVADTDFYLRNLSKTEQRIEYVEANLGALNVIKTTPVTTILQVGYTADNCPKSIIAAIKLIISRLYEFREDTSQDKTLASQNILRAFKVWN